MTVKSHHISLASVPILAIAQGWQAAQGQTVDITDPVVWGTLFSFVITIVGLFRNKPQGSVTTTKPDGTTVTTSS